MAVAKPGGVELRAPAGVLFTRRRLGESESAVAHDIIRYVTNMPSKKLVRASLPIRETEQWIHIN